MMIKFDHFEGIEDMLANFYKKQNQGVSIHFFQLKYYFFTKNYGKID